MWVVVGWVADDFRGNAAGAGSDLGFGCAVCGVERVGVAEPGGCRRSCRCRAATDVWWHGVHGCRDRVLPGQVDGGYGTFEGAGAFVVPAGGHAVASGLTVRAPLTNRGTVEVSGCPGLVLGADLVNEGTITGQGCVVAANGASPWVVVSPAGSIDLSGGLSIQVPVVFTHDPVNDPPFAGDDSVAVAEDGMLSVGAPGVLGNDGDVDGDVLSAVLVSSPVQGTLILNVDGSFMLHPCGRLQWHRRVHKLQGQRRYQRLADCDGLDNGQRGQRRAVRCE